MSAEKEDNYDDDYYDEGYDDEDFEEFDSQSRKSSPLKATRASTPYLYKQVPYSGEACITDDCVDTGGDECDYEAGDNDAATDADGAALDVDLESYMNKYLPTTQHPSEVCEASSSETRPLDGLVPTEQLSGSLDEQMSRKPIAYSPSPKKKSVRLEADEGKGSATPRSAVKVVDVESYMNSFKSLLEMSDNGNGRPADAEHKQHALPLKPDAASHVSRKVVHSRVSFDISSPAADIDSPSTSMPDRGERKPREPAYSANDEENSARVDALLLELFPERFQRKQQPPKNTKSKPGAISKKSGQGGYNRNQSYGLGAVSVPSELVGSSSAGAFDSKPSNALDRDVFSAGSSTSLLTIPVLEQQVKLLKKELKVKDDKLARLTEHAVMMGHHMDRLKGENAQLAHQLKEAVLEKEAKEHRLNQALKHRKKPRKKPVDDSSSPVERQNERLREREAALLEAIDELSNQNEDLIEKLKESMERELIQSSKRAAQISHSVSALVLPDIAHRDTPDETAPAAAAKRSSRKK